MSKILKENLERQISKLLKDNPKIKEALRVFNISSKDYRKALEARIQKPAVTNFNSTDPYGNMARNRE